MSNFAIVQSFTGRRRREYAWLCDVTTAESRAAAVAIVCAFGGSDLGDVKELGAHPIGALLAGKAAASLADGAGAFANALAAVGLTVEPASPKTANPGPCPVDLAKLVAVPACAVAIRETAPKPANAPALSPLAALEAYAAQRQAEIAAAEAAAKKSAPARPVAPPAPAPVASAPTVAKAKATIGRPVRKATKTLAPTTYIVRYTAGDVCERRLFSGENSEAETRAWALDLQAKHGAAAPEGATIAIYDAAVFGVALAAVERQGGRWVATIGAKKATRAA